jgi:hypothetical protein
LTEQQQRTLLRLLKVAYPHPDFPDDPYERTAKASVMTTGAAANPTLTIVALATRQADHILQEMNAGNL